jgi:hypothetical protein
MVMGAGKTDLNDEKKTEETYTECVNCGDENIEGTLFGDPLCEKCFERAQDDLFGFGDED